MQSKPKLLSQSSSSIEIDDEELKEMLSSDSEKVIIPIELVDSSSSKGFSHTIEVASSESSLNLLEFGQRKRPPGEKRSIIFQQGIKEIEIENDDTPTSLLKIPPGTGATAKPTTK